MTLGADRFVGGSVFDPAHPVAYLLGRELHHRKLDPAELFGPRGRP
ncbi:hypothetical protein [Methylotetracoccus oryzae]|nr:hypothetical protein [Methylotetracoccus oryzae]